MTSGVKGNMVIHTYPDWFTTVVEYRTTKGKLIADGKADGVDNKALCLAFAKCLRKIQIKYNKGQNDMKF
jgi:hypothetical protein